MRSRVLKTIAFSAAFALLCSVTVSAEQATVTGRGVNVRSGPGVNYRIITSLPKGTTVEVTSRSNGEWYAVRIGNETGYMSSAYLSFDGTEATGMPDIYITDGSSDGSADSAESIFLPESTVDTPEATSAADSGAASETPPVPAAPKVPGLFPEHPVILTPVPYSPWLPAEMAEPVATPSPTPTPTPSLIPPPLPEVTVAPLPTAMPVTTPEPAVTEQTQGEESDTAENTASAIVTGDYVRFRTGPSLSFPIIATFNKGTEVFTEEESNGWTKCTVNGKTGYISSQYISRRTDGSASGASSADETGVQAVEAYAQSRDGYITGNNVRFRSAPSLYGDILGEFYFSNAVRITGVSGEWTAVSARGQEGFVYSLYVAEGEYAKENKIEQGDTLQETPQESASPIMTASSGREVADFALQYLGYRYCWGGADPAAGFDCSGFVYYVYSRFGYTLNRVAADQVKNGTAVSKDALQPGDVLCFYSSGTVIGHSGIYIGDGKFIHSANSKTGVIITELSGNYEKLGYEARRIVN